MIFHEDVQTSQPETNGHRVIVPQRNYIILNDITHDDIENGVI